MGCFQVVWMRETPPPERTFRLNRPVSWLTRTAEMACAPVLPVLTSVAMPLSPGFSLLMATALPEEVRTFVPGVKLNPQRAATPARSASGAKTEHYA